MKIITQNPGISVAELGRKMRLKAPNYLYRVLPDLEKEGADQAQGAGLPPGVAACINGLQLRLEHPI